MKIIKFSNIPSDWLFFLLKKGKKQKKRKENAKQQKKWKIKKLKQINKKKFY